MEMQRATFFLHGRSIFTPEQREEPHEKSNRTVPLNFSQPNKLKNRLLVRSGSSKSKNSKQTMHHL